MEHPKKKWKSARIDFKKDLNKLLKDKPILCALIVETMTTSRIRSHVYKVRELLGFHHREAYNDYNQKLAGQMLTGRESIWYPLFLANPDLVKKWSKNIPHSYAFADAYAVAKRHGIFSYQV